MEKSFNTKNVIISIVILLITVMLWVLPTESFGIDGLTVIQQRTMAIFVFAALMWLFEVIPAWATSVTTIVGLLFAVSNKGFMVDDAGTPVNYKEVMASFADPVIMLFLGGFVLAIAANKVGLDAYLARTLLRIFGSKPKYVLLGLLLVPGTFSMFMSNTATAAMMLAFMAPVLKNLPKDSAAPAALTLAIPIAANFGGLGTPIGTPPNAIALGALTKVGIDISFGSWVIHMVPFVLLLLLIAWFVLMLFFPMKMEKLEIEIESNAKFDRDFWIVAITMPVTILLWVTEGWTHFDSNIVALVPFAVFAITGVFKEEDFPKIASLVDQPRLQILPLLGQILRCLSKEQELVLPLLPGLSGLILDHADKVLQRQVVPPAEVHRRHSPCGDRGKRRQPYDRLRAPDLPVEEAVRNQQHILPAEPVGV